MAEPTYLQKLSQVESSNNRDAVNKTTMAMGLYQFTPKTQELLEKKYPELKDFDPFDVDDAQRAASLLTNENVTALERENISATDQNKYVMHFMGNASGRRLIKAAVDDNLKDQPASTVFAREARDNPSLFDNKTVSEVYNTLGDKINSVTEVNPITSAPTVDVTTPTPKPKRLDPDKQRAEDITKAQALSEIRNVKVPKDFDTETPSSKNIDLPKKTEKEGIMDMLFGLFGGEKEPVKESPVIEDPAAEGLKLLGGHRQRTLSTSNIGMARGGMVKQMSMFDEGGLLDQGGETDPVSGNDVPPGSLKEEVRDDIPAQLSEGEFVFPADVVRYIGLEKLMQMRQEAKMGLKRMEEMGQMGNSDEATMPDDLPFTLDDLDVDDEPQMFQAGGVVQPAGFTGITDLQASQFAPAPQQFQQFGYTPPPPPPTPQAYVPTQQATIPTMEVPSELPTFEQLIPAPEGRYDELIEFENKETGQKMSIPFVDGQPIYPIPNGFTRVPTDIIKPEVPETVVPTARVESAVDDGDDEAQRRREAEEEAMYGPGGGRVALGGELYTGPTKFVGDNIKTRLISGTVRGSTKVGVSFNVPGSNALGLAGGLAFGKGIPENATATFFLNGATYTVNSEMYNRMKENKFRGDESNSILAKLKDARSIMTEKKVSAKDAETILDIREKLESSKAEQDDLFLEAFEAGEERREAERRLKEMQEREEERKRQLEAERRRAEQETKDMSYQEQQQYREERESEREEQIKDSSGGRQEQDRIDNIRDDSNRQREQERFDSGARQEAERQTYEETGIGGSDYAKMYGNKGGLASKPKPKVKKMKRGGLASKK